MKRRSNHNFVLGYTDTETVKLDFDNTTLKTAKYWAKRTMKWFRLSGFLILKSSKGCYHIIFNKTVTWAENVNIMSFVVINSNNPSLQKWFNLQCRKQGSTLRISPKGDKPSPRIVYRFGDEENQIKEFVKFRKMIKRMERKLEGSN